MVAKKDANAYEPILRRLDVLIALLLDTGDGGRSVSDKAVRLSSLGLTTGEIGEILNKPSNYVAAILATQHKRAGKTRRNE
jgi:hypothetical protein